MEDQAENKATQPKICARLIVQTNREGNEMFRHLIRLMGLEGREFEQVPDSVCQRCGKVGVFVGFNLEDLTLCKSCYEDDKVNTVFPFETSDFQNFRVKLFTLQRQGCEWKANAEQQGLIADGKLVEIDEEDIVGFTNGKVDYAEFATQTLPHYAKKAMEKFGIVVEEIK